MKVFRNISPYLLLLLPLMYFAIFLHLDSRCFRMWDEAYLASHTYDMMHDHDYIVTHSFGVPEMSNTKPPLVIWFMVASCKVLGFNELGIRLPNALAAIALCLFIFFLLTRITRSATAGMAAVLALITSSGYMSGHVVRTGEYDSFLTLFVAIYCLLFFLLTEDNEPTRQRWLWVCFSVAVIGAILTKGIAGVTVMPAIGIYAVARGKLLWLLRSKETYISIFFIAFFGLGYYLLREHFNPGYLAAVYENELGGRFLKTNEGHQEAPGFYADIIFNRYFIYWMPMVVVALVGAMVSALESKTTRLVYFCALTATVFTSVLSISATKLYWYIAPALPFLAVMAGVGVSLIVRMVFGGLIEQLTTGKKAYVLLLMCLLAIAPYSKVIAENQIREDTQWDGDNHTIGIYVNYKLSKHQSLDGYKIIHDGETYRVTMCEVFKLADKGQHVDVVEVSGLNIGDKIIMRNADDKAKAEKLFKLTWIESFNRAQVWQVSDTIMTVN